MTNFANNIVKGGVAPYNNMASYDPLQMGLNDQFKDSKVISGFEDMNKPCNFKVQQSQIVSGGAKKRKYKNKKGGDIFKDLTTSDLYNTTYLGNTQAYAPLNIANIDERGTNFAIDKSQFGGIKKNNNKQNNKKQNNNKKGGDIFKDLTTSDLYNTTYLGNTQAYAPLNIANIDERGTNFAIDKSQFGGIKKNNNKKQNNKKRINKKKGGDIFSDVSLSDILNNKYLGNTQPYTPLNVANIDERGTNFAIDRSQFGGKNIKILKNKNKTINKFFHQMIVKSYYDFKKNKIYGGDNSFQSGLADLLMNSFNEKGDVLPNSAHYNTAYLNNSNPFKLNEPQRVYVTLKSNFSL
jgi:hypothetical protein